MYEANKSNIFSISTIINIIWNMFLHDFGEYNSYITDISYNSAHIYIFFLSEILP